jgi:hypothetical protein
MNIKADKSRHALIRTILYWETTYSATIFSLLKAVFLGSNIETG